MHIKVHSAEKGNNKGSSRNLVNYLEKENQELGKDRQYFFNLDRSMIPGEEVIRELDNNKAKLSRDDAKFYSLSVSPSEKELVHLGNSREDQATALKAYTRTVMDEYAKNFNKGLNVEDIKWYGKVEYSRHYKGSDKEARSGRTKQGDLKPGNNMHVHVIVSRKDVSNTKKLSPLTNHQHTRGGPVKGGFSRDQFKDRTERAFDQQFNHKRELQDSYRYVNTMKNGSVQDKIEMREHSAELRFAQFADQGLGTVASPKVQAQEEEREQLRKKKRKRGRGFS